MAKKCMSKLCTNPLGQPPPRRTQHRNKVNGLQPLYIAWMVILLDHIIKKMSFKNIDFSATRGEKLHEQVVYHSLGTPPPTPRPPKTQIR